MNYEDGLSEENGKCSNAREAGICYGRWQMYIVQCQLQQPPTPWIINTDWPGTTYSRPTCQPVQPTPDNNRQITAYLRFICSACNFCNQRMTLAYARHHKHNRTREICAVISACAPTLAGMYVCLQFSLVLNLIIFIRHKSGYKIHIMQHFKNERKLN